MAEPAAVPAGRSAEIERALLDPVADRGASPVAVRGSHTLIRLSLQGYNDEADLDRLLGGAGHAGPGVVG